MRHYDKNRVKLAMYKLDNLKKNEHVRFICRIQLPIYQYYIGDCNWHMHLNFK